MGTFTNGAQCGISSGSTLFVKFKRSSDKKIQVFLDYNLTHLHTYNGLSQVYFTK